MRNFSLATILKAQHQSIFSYLLSMQAPVSKWPFISHCNPTQGLTFDIVYNTCETESPGTCTSLFSKSLECCAGAALPLCIVNIEMSSSLTSTVFFEWLSLSCRRQINVACCYSRVKVLRWDASGSQLSELRVVGFSPRLDVGSN